MLLSLIQNASTHIHPYENLKPPKIPKNPIKKPKMCRGCLVLDSLGFSIGFSQLKISTRSLSASKPLKPLADVPIPNGDVPFKMAS
jgi:hypothetical protein